MRTIVSFLLWVVVWVILVLIPAGLWKIFLPGVTPAASLIAIYCVYMFIMIYPTSFLVKDFRDEMGWIIILPIFLFSSCNPDLGMKSLTLYEYCGDLTTGPYENEVIYGATKDELDAAMLAAKTSNCQIVILSAEKMSWYPKRDTLFRKMPDYHKIMSRRWDQ